MTSGISSRPRRSPASGDKQYFCGYEGCDKSYFSRANMLHHQVYKHGRQRGQPGPCIMKAVTDPVGGNVEPFGAAAAPKESFPRQIAYSQEQYRDQYEIDQMPSQHELQDVTGQMAYLPNIQADFGQTMPWSFTL